MELEIYKMLYKKENDDNYNLRILGNIFVKNNKGKGKLIINNKKQAIKEFINTQSINTDKIKIKILLSKIIYNKSYFFKDCKSLLEISMSDNEKNLQKESSNIIRFKPKDEKEDENFLDLYASGDKDSNFYDDLENYPYNNISEISNTEKKSGISTINYWRNNVKLYSSKCYFNFYQMFYNCSSLYSLSDIFNLNNNIRINILDMSHMFFNCLSLPNLPDISMWNIENVIDISLLFYNCLSLKTIPNISLWNTINIIDMHGLLSNCSSLISLPDIFFWRTDNVIDIHGLFSNCSSLISLPDIIRKTDNVIDMHGLFSNCSSLKSLPDISRWTTKNVIDMQAFIFKLFIINKIT